MFDFNSFIQNRWIVLGYLGDHWHQWWFPSHLLTVSSMISNQVVSTMFDFKTCNQMVRFVLWVTRLKTLDIIFVIQVAMEYTWFATHRSTVYDSWLCRLDWKFVAQIHSVFRWLCYIVTAWIHSVWLVAMTLVYDVISLWSEYGNAYLINWYTWYSVDAWVFASFRLDVLLVLDTHMQLTKSIDCH